MEEEQRVITELDVSNLTEGVKIINDINDIFDTYSKAISICNFLELEANKKILEENNLIAIYGSWGIGKSCLMRTIEDKIDKNEFETIWFDTWKYEKDENLGFSLLKYVVKDRVFTQLKEKGRAFLDNAYGIFKSLAKGVTAEIEVGGIALNINAADALEQAEVQTQRIRERKENEKSLWERIDEFEKNFKKLTFDDKRLVVFLDDLDRCESENIITLMSSIKLLLSVNPNIIFILGVDKSAVTLALRNKYGNDENKADEYLEKIFSITFEMSSKLKTENFKNYISSITGLSVEDSQVVVDFLCEIDFTNSRHIKKVFRKYYFIKEYLKSNSIDLTNKFKVIFILYNIILAIFYNDEYQYLLMSNPEVKYIGLTQYTVNKGVRTDHCYEQFNKQGSIKGMNYEEGYFDLWEKLSSYKIKDNSELKGGRFINYYDWKSIFEDNICSRFIDFILGTEGFLNEFIEETKEFKKEEIELLINKINLVM